MRMNVFNYVDDLDEAIEFYQKAFGAKIMESETWKKEDGKYMICTFEMEDGGTFSFSNRNGEGAAEGGAITGEANTGNIMQLCMYYKKKDLAKLEKAYEILSKEGTVRTALSPSEWTSHTCDLVDKYGIRWCLMIWGD